MLREAAFGAMIIGCAISASENYYAEISPEVSAEIQQLVIAGEYREYLDFNGDGKLTIADSVGVERKYQYNVSNGNIVVFDREDAQEIIAENYADSPVEWEISSINDEPCTLYEVEISDITRLTILLDFVERGETLEIQVNPYTESLDYVREK